MNLLLKGPLFLLIFVIFILSCATRIEKPYIEDPHDLPDEEKIIARIAEEIERGDIESALKTYEEGNIDDPLLYAMLLLNNDMIDKAEQVLLEILEKDNASIEALYFLSLVHNRRNDTENEKAVLENIISLDPQHQDAMISLGRIYASEKNYKKAESYFKAVLDNNGSANIEARLGYANILMQQNKKEPALEQYTLVIEEEPDNMIAYIDRGFIKAMQEDYRAAEKDFTEAVRIDPDYLWNYIDRGRVRFYSGNLRAAEEDFSKALEIDSSLFTAYAQRAEIYEMLGENDQALEDYRQALEIRSDFYKGFVPAAAQHFRREEWEKAAHYFLKAYSLDTSYEFVLLSAAALIKNKERDKAEKLIREKMNTISRDDSLFHISRLFIDPGYETLALRRVNDEKSSFKRYKGLFYIALYYDSYGKNLLSEKIYSDIINSEFPPDTLEYKLSYWRITE